MHVFFAAANIALKQYSYYEDGSFFRPQHANDGIPSRCFWTREKTPWWNLELGANVRVSMVFILKNPRDNFEGYEMLIGECVLSKAFCIFCLLLFGSLLSSISIMYLGNISAFP